MSALTLVHHLLSEEGSLSDQENFCTEGPPNCAPCAPKAGPRHYEERRLRRLALAQESPSGTREVLQPVSAHTHSLQGQECVERLLKYGGQRSRQRERLSKEYHMQERAEVRETKPPPSFAGPIKNSTEACLTLYEEGKTKLKKRDAFQERELAALRVPLQLSEGTRALLAKGQGRPRPKKKLEPVEYSFKPALNPHSVRLLANRPRQALHQPKLPSTLPSFCVLSPQSNNSPHRSAEQSHSKISSPHSFSSQSITSSPSAKRATSSPLHSTPRFHHEPSHASRTVSPRELLSLLAHKSPPSEREHISPIAHDEDNTDDEEYLYSHPSSTTPSSSFLTGSSSNSSSFPICTSSLKQHIERQAAARQKRAEAALPVHVTGANWKPRKSTATTQGFELGILLQELVLLNQAHDKN